jgi:hypothetical protein
MHNRIYERVGRGTWQVITQVVGVVGGQWLLQVCKTRHMAVSAAPIEVHKEATENQKIQKQSNIGL